MNNFYFVIPAVIAYISILVLFLKQAVPNNQILFGVTLPSHALEDETMKKLQAEYKKSYTIYGVAMLLSLVPFFFLGQYFSLSLIYMIVWLAAFLYTSKLPFNSIHYKAAALKRENEWFVGEKRMIRIDTKITQLKKAMLVSPYWFLIPALLSIVPILLSFQNKDVLLRMTGIASLAMTVILYVIYAAFGNMKTKVYSDNIDINAAINRAARRYWSMLWPILATFESINAYVAYLILTTGSSSLSFTQWMIGIVMVSLVPLGSIFFVHNKVRALEESLAETDGEAIPSDDDGFWINGSTYYNPDDKSVMVPKRVGVGTTLNMATRGGKWIQYGGMALALLIILPLAAFAVQSDHTSPALTIADSGTVSIDYPLYDYSFNLSDVKGITLEESLPNGFRTNGTATAEYARGSFSLEKLGAAKLYVFKNSPPYIFIQLEDHTVIFNEKDAAKTEAIFNELKAHITP
ncbi:DUF5808 domain-containing protein [Paenibacillus sp. LHD-38]|uniref:DUF5808 domain-containing protein n=1 Tax=Paenibacillus sp. LHD-38 TaxID=3072143 RepID=UPI00280C9B01|nr:DUF5808 domain-containing protein [Paenibacillus sp. LHD-38]MDQ8737585.1 DUF5808 domain-containing protein [Paenibacillus sp. LHD-38]